MLLLARFVIALVLAGGASAAASDVPLAVIVNAARADTLTEHDLEQIYLRQRRYWADGPAIVPVNREGGSRARHTFTARILRLSPERLAAYWNERYFDGIFPPLTLSSDAAVVRYVAANRNAVGYVAPSAVPDSVREVLRLEPDPSP